MSGRVLVLSVAVQEIARALAPAQAEAVAKAIRARLEQLGAQHPTGAEDEGMTAELVPFLAALGSMA